jgi:predicted  nucleic acid-binding Zn-ribbon protein
MSREFTEINKNITKLDKNVDNLEKKFSKINVNLQRIENKVNHIINFLEEFLVADSDDEYAEDNFDSDETWVPDPESWKNEEDIDEDQY